MNNKSIEKHELIYIKVVGKIFLIAIFFVSLSCETDIPETDTTPPEFDFKISGDGFDHAFNQDDIFDSFQLNLKENETYDFVFTAGDEGGLKYMQMLFAIDYLEFQTNTPNTWTDSNNGFSRAITWQGNVNNPITGNILTGTFITRGDQNDTVSMSISLSMQDFGGESGNGNTMFKDLNIHIGNHNTEIVEF
ncbi:hypothetical protein Q4Q34_10675 [Flavivirga abyssicola]|uniref:hypothetical protein n=1 Tax=Flavivirga abyssicola TaxID=3063533 RepID=UPI0026DF51E5|nr:hypothetical protein [Flavivirga sp. MEBiC07777]WVK11689.1 hypothetical protein Q4Q34_10675 [Flavivirga sp. MEBiC07777]